MQPSKQGFQLQSCLGMVPDVVGHFLGEYFVAYICTPLTLPDPMSRSLFHKSAKACRGWCGLFLVTQGPWAHQGQHISDTVSLVQVLRSDASSGQRVREQKAGVAGKSYSLEWKVLSTYVMCE
jgi:hypothetical protein